MVPQNTITQPTKIKGVNVYSGRRNHVIFHPAKEDSGLVFLLNGERIPAKLELADNVRKGISLSNGKQRVYLVEHLLSAVYSLGIDNLEIELSDNTCPTTTNCASEYFSALKDIKKLQDKSKRFWSVQEDRAVEVNNLPDKLGIFSSEGFSVSCVYRYPHKIIGEQKCSFKFGVDSYEKIAGARPPGFLGNEFVLGLVHIANKLGWKGVTPDNYLLITSQNALQYSSPETSLIKHDGTEFVKHKIVDEIGTLALTGRHFVNTEFQFYMTGHKTDLHVLKELFKEGYFKDSLA